MFDNIVKWLSSPYTLVKLIRLWVILGYVMLSLILIEGKHFYAIILSVMLLVFFILSIHIEKLAGESSEGKPDNS